MGHLQFLREKLAPFGLVVGGLLTIYGIVSDALDLYRLGLPGWVWQIAGVVVVIVSLLLFVHRNRVAIPSVEPAAVTPVFAEERAEHRDDQRRHQAVIGEMASTAHEIGWALGEGHQETMRNALPGLKATLLTLAKAYGVDIPVFPVGVSTKRCLEAGVRYLTDVGALLRQGHVEEARECAEQLVPMLNAFIEAGKAEG